MAGQKVHHKSSPHRDTTKYSIFDIKASVTCSGNF